MKRRKLRTCVPAILIALSTIMVNTPAVTAHGNEGPSWTDSEQGYLTQNGGTYKHYIPVCLETSVYGPIWDTVNHPNHARIVNALGSWNNNDGELPLYTANTACSVWRSYNTPFLSIDKSNIGPLATRKPQKEHSAMKLGASGAAWK